jgi:hypothetical protein
MSLRDLQIWMVSAITASPADARSDDIERFVKAGPRASASVGFEVYRAGYFARLLECLRDDFPVLDCTLGEERFKDLCRAYVDRHPSSSPNLNGFGRLLPSFCVREGVLPTSDATWAHDLARLEWALVEVLHAPMSAPLAHNFLSQIAPDAWASARFVPSASLRVLRFDYPVNAMFMANRLDGVIPNVPAPAPTALAVYRKDAQLWRMDLSPSMLQLLTPLCDGKTLGEALSALENDGAAMASVAANLTVWFREWVDAGFFERVEFTT